MENHSGVADRTDFSVDSAVARVKGKHHDGDVLSWMAYYAVKSGGTASSLVLLDDEDFFYTKNHSGKTAPSYLQKIKKTEVKPNLFKEEFKCITKFPIT